MKKIFYSLLVLGLVASTACKKDTVKVPPKAFEDVTYSDIKNLQIKFSDQKVIVSTAADGSILKAGSILFYRTNNGILGKFKIVSITAQNFLIIDVLNYDANGSVILFKQSVSIENTFFCDLDLGNQSPDALVADFKWGHGASIEDGYIQPFPNCKFYIYSK